MRIVPVLAPVLVLVLSAPARAQDPPPEDLQIFREGDAALSCVQISDEAAELSQRMGGDRPGVFGRLTGVARSGASLLVPGAGLAIAGVDVLTREDRERREAQARAVEQRWYYLNGLYTGLRCAQPSSASAAPPS
jgi:hypothetical protein